METAACADASVGWAYEGPAVQAADFTGGLKAALGGSLAEVLAFGPLNRNFEWHVTVRTEAAKQKLLEKEMLVVKETCVSRPDAVLASEAGTGPLGAVPLADGRHRAAVGEARRGGGHFVGDGTEGGRVRHPDGGARLHHKG